MFTLTDQPIDPAAERADLLNDEVGGFVAFEGWVRRHNLGQTVIALEYEGAGSLAEHEFAAIETEARERFDVTGIRCVHRVGRLEIGDLAVWLGVTAAHRDPAFKACRFVIDELKERLPIWKKEHYTEGSSDWLNHP